MPVCVLVFGNVHPYHQNMSHLSVRIGKVSIKTKKWGLMKRNDDYNIFNYNNFQILITTFTVEAT